MSGRIPPHFAAVSAMYPQLRLMRAATITLRASAGSLRPKGGQGVAESGRRRERKCFGEQFVGAPARGMVIDRGGDHQFIRVCRFDERQQPALNALDAADDQPSAMAREPFAIDGGIGIGGSLRGRSERQIFTLSAVDEIEIDARAASASLSAAITAVARIAQGCASAVDGLKCAR